MIFICLFLKIFSCICLFASGVGSFIKAMEESSFIWIIITLIIISLLVTITYSNL